MTHQPLQLLADTDPGKLIGGLVVIVFWIIGAIVTAATKKKESQQRQEVRDSIESAARARALQQQAELQAQQRVQRPPLAAAPPVIRPQLAEGVRMRVPPPAPVRMPRPKPAPKRFGQSPPRMPQMAAKVIKPPLPPRPKEQEPAAASRHVVDAPLTNPRPQPSTAGAAVIHKWFRPATLRQQFILTELLHPPLSLRE